MAFPKHLNILLNKHSVINVSETGEVLDSYLSDLPIAELLSRALGFSYKVYSSEFGGNVSNDFIIGYYILHESFYKYASYPTGITDITFAIKKPDYRSQTVPSLCPFSLNVWLGFILSVILISMMHLLIFRERIPFLSVFFHTLVTFLGVHRDWSPKSLSQKILVLTGSIGIMFLTLGYGSVLLSSMTIPTREKSITNFDELFQAIYLKKVTAVTFQRSGVVEELLGSRNEKIKFIGQHAKMQNEVDLRDFRKAVEVIQPNVAVIAARSTLEALYEGEEYYISHDSVGQAFYVIYFQDFYFCCMQQIEKVIHRIWASGLNQKIENDKDFFDVLFRPSNFTNFKSNMQNPIRPLSLSSLSDAFYILIIGNTLGVLCLLCEIFAYHYFF